MKTKISTVVLVGCVCNLLFATPQITNVKAEAYSPWGKVAISYTLNEDVPDSDYPFIVTASNRNTKAVHTARSLTGDVSYKKGTHQIWWDMAADNISLAEASLDFRVVIIEGVQLWKDGPYWAIRNIGATKPEEAGWYFWWGDTVGCKRENNRWVKLDGSNGNYSFSSCTTYEKSTTWLRNNGWIDASGNLTANHDAAVRYWGRNWRIPTKDEIEGLVNNCTRTWTTRNGTKGYLVTGKGKYNTKSIFIPAAGYGDRGDHNKSGVQGHYWSSAPKDSYFAYKLFFYWDTIYSGEFYLSGAYHYAGNPVRPVAEFTK